MLTTNLNSSPDFGSVFHALPGLYLIISPALTIVDASDAYLRATLQERHALIGCNVFDIFPNNPETPDLDPVQLLKQSLDYVLQNRERHTMPNLRYDIPRPEHLGGGFSERYWSAVNIPVLDEAGNLLHILHKANDITEKLAGELIQMHRQEQVSLLNSAVEAVSWEYNFRSNSMSWGAGLKDIFGYLPEEMEEGLSSWEKRVHPEDYCAIEESLEKVTEAGSKIWTGEYRFLKADGTYTEVLDQSYLIYDSHGKALLALGSIINVSKSKRAEQHLKESNARFRHLLEVLPHMAWTSEPNGSGMYFNQGWYSYTGIKEGYAEIWVRAVHPDDSAFVLTSWHEALVNKTSFEIEYRIRNAYDGRYRWFLERGVPMYDQDGNVKLWIGTYTDIDDQKEAIEQLRRKDQRLQDILQLSPANICLLQGADHICKFVTPGIYTMFGNRNYLGNSALEIWPETTKNNLPYLLDQVYRHGKVMSLQEVHLPVEPDKRGEITDAFFNIKLQPLEDAEGNTEGVLLTATEVTDLVRARQEIENLRVQLHRL